jgi:hypothetical protein
MKIFLGEGMPTGALHNLLVTTSADKSDWRIVDVEEIEE